MRWDIFLVTSVLACVALLLLGLVVVIRNPKARTNQVFALLSVTLALWAATIYVSNNQHLTYELALLANRLVFFAASASGALLIWLIYRTVNNQLLQKHRKLLFVIAAIGVAMSILPGIVKGIAKQGDVYAIDFGLAAIPYFISLSILVCAVMVMLVVICRSTDGTDRKRAQSLRNIMLVFLIAMVMTNLVPPLLSYFQLTSLGAIVILYLAVALAYLIIKKDVFNIKSAIFVSIGYILTVLLLSILYGGVITIVAVIILNLDITSTESAELAIVIAIFTTLLQPVKNFIDKAIRKVFWSDHYDSNVVIEKVNKILISTIDASKMIKGTMDVVNHYLKPNFWYVAVIDRQNEKISSHHVGKHNIKKDDVHHIADLTKSKTEVIKIVDNMPWGDDQLKLTMDLLDINLLMVINDKATTTDDDTSSRKLLLIGSKRNGSSYTKKDVNVLSAIFRELSIGLQNAMRFNYINQFNVLLEEKVDSATAELKHTNRKLQKLDEVKDDFISMASHQLRTPLTSVRGYLSMLLDGDFGKLTDKQREVITEAYTNSGRMAFLIGDFLDVSRLQTGEFELQISPTDLVEILDGELSQLRATAAAHNVTIKYSPSTDLATINCDSNKLRQVMMNMIDNAIFYSRGGGSIEIDLYQQRGQIVFTVRDHGIGVPQGEQMKLFTKFFRGSNARHVRPDGTGIGLYVARKVVLAHNGSIIFESRENRGSTFGFKLPIERL